MAETVRQAEVLKKIIAMLTKEFGCKVYSDEVKEKFAKPCFFIAATSVMTPQSVNWLQKELTILLTYYADTKNKNEIHYLDVVDRVQGLFPVGIQVNDRFLKIDSIEDGRAGEEQDILQITIVIPYLEHVVKPASTSELMGELRLSVTHDGGRNAREIFTGNIDKDTL